jgi:crotonobetainyl-CoA:carnitine CoA-transferase CaiB-like acyl-CoA transferase
MRTSCRTPHGVRARLDDLFSRKPTDYWLGLHHAAGIWCARVTTITDLLDNEPVASNDYLTALDEGLRTVSMPQLSGYQAPAVGGRSHGADDEFLAGVRQLARRAMANYTYLVRPVGGD